MAQQAIRRGASQLGTAAMSSTIAIQTSTQSNPQVESSSTTAPPTLSTPVSTSTSTPTSTGPSTSAQQKQQSYHPLYPSRKGIGHDEIDDVSHVVFASSRVGGVAGVSGERNDSILQVHTDELMNTHLLQLGSKLAANKNIQAGILEELTRDWTMMKSVESINTQSSLEESSTHSTTTATQPSTGGQRVLPNINTSASIARDSVRAQRTYIKRQHPRGTHTATQQVLELDNNTSGNQTVGGDNNSSNSPLAGDGNGSASNGSEIKSPLSVGVDNVSPASRFSNASGLSNWSEASDDDFIRFSGDDDELARSFSSLRRALSGGAGERRQSFGPVQEGEGERGNELLDDLELLTSASEMNQMGDSNVIASHYETISGYNISGSHFNIKIPTTPPITAVERQRSVSNFDEALSSLSSPMSAALTRNISGGDEILRERDATSHMSDDEDDEDFGVVLRLVKWIQRKVFGLSVHVQPPPHDRVRTLSDRPSIMTTLKEVDQENDENVNDNVTAANTNVTSTGAIKHSISTYRKKASDRMKEMEDAFLNGSYVKIALGVAGILIALVLCKRYSPTMFQRLVNMLRKSTDRRFAVPTT